ncbi:hypothetical protein EXIGLDRAFT_834756 [Exidia glandulosa HHB12029]|uniref:Uncharacterized protein n=1 Tax=Exidia glandulosa HHB12029 TaxID=1314781 RepID=A0A165JG02_EXIGL|nr:hypothetical protein EXIGLDRAFT_834756 [Exidia glandulosa HHB12029]
MANLPVELVQDIVLTASRCMIADVRWVGQCLALTSHDVYSWVAPILFESWYILPAKIEQFLDLAATRGSIVSHARTLIMVVPSPSPIHTTRTFHACAQLEVVKVPTYLLAAFARLPGFRPTTVHALDNWSLRILLAPDSCDVVRPLLASVKRLCIRDLDALSRTNDSNPFYPPTLRPLLPSVTHVIVMSFSSDDMPRLRHLLQVPNLERLLIWRVWLAGRPANRQEAFDTLAALKDKRVCYPLETMEVNDPELRQFAVPSGPARLQRDGRDIWSLGTSVLLHMIKVRKLIYPSLCPL